MTGKKSIPSNRREITHGCCDNASLCTERTLKTHMLGLICNLGEGQKSSHHLGQPKDERKRQGDAPSNGKGWDSRKVPSKKSISQNG